ncbi:MAG: FtsW/RodA/SpoVE family cell cycle protein [Flavobacteriaceae bacterium]|nr:FtsW/RodA/SpoVE family cell cycle protein [Flavobacteriaceae bacterium]
MNNIFQHIKGDRTIWAIIAMLAIFSFLPIYSASTNLVYVVSNGTTTGHLIKHAILLSLGFIIIYTTHKIPYRYFSGLSVIMIPIVLVLLAYTLFQPRNQDAIMAARWISVPFTSFKFQTSTLAGVILMIYIARYFARNKDKKIEFKQSIVPLWLPIIAVISLILPANFSTAAILFVMVIMLTFFGNYPIKYILGILSLGIVMLLFFIITIKAFPKNFKNSRVQTWVNRIDNYSDKDSKENYQSHKAKVAVYSGGITGKGPGKSIQKNFLPQASSDFIYAIIAEEYGLIGALFLIVLYLLLLFRVVIVATKTKTIFGTLAVLGVGIPIIFQALTNMAVAVGLFPVTGQPLPLISAGGTSIWMTCFAIGIILSVSAAKGEDITKINKDIDTDNPLDVLHKAIG